MDGRIPILLGATFLLLAACLTVPAEPPVAPEARVVGWDDLTVKVEFEDPFEALTEEQLMKLSIYARVKTMKEHTPEKVSEAMGKEADEAEVWLKGEGVDIGGLLAKREEIKNLRRQRASATNPKLAGQLIRMPGYALPLEYDGKAVTEFLLVPWVGACIHTPPPPPNQIVHVELDGGYEVKSRFEPVWVSGTMAISNVTQNLYLVDGASDINIGYTLTGAGVTAYRSKKQAAVGK